MELAQSVKRILALAFLPANLIIPEFRRQKAAMPGRLLELLDNFLKYFDNYWLKIVTREGFSCYGLSMRTNNCTESFNSELAYKLDKRPEAPDFVRKNIYRTLFLSLVMVTA